jgi:hypothetical protein
VSAAREVVVLKAAQCGLSAWAVRFAIYGADLLGWTSLFCFPTEIEMQRFSTRRLRSAIRGSEYLMSRMPEKAIDSVMQKQVGLGWVEFRGMNVEIDALDADVLVLDEFSRMDPELVAVAEARVSSAEAAGLVRRLGTPDVPGAGVSAAFEERSDARVWHVKCGRCGHWNGLRGLAAFEANVDVEKARLVCAECRRPIDVREGEWVPTYERDVVGFCVPKMLIPHLDLRPLIERSQRTRPSERRAFMTRDLGEGWVDESERLSLEQVRGCVDESLRPQLSYLDENPVVMGVDVAGARALNVSIEEMLDAEHGRKLWVGEIEDRDGKNVLEQLCQLMADFRVWMAVIDAGPETRMAKAFAELFPGKVYRCSYTMPSGGRREPETSHVDHDQRHVSVWRTVLLENAIDRFRRRQIALPPLDLLPTDYARQLGNAVRVVQERSGWRPVATFVRTGGADDYLHAEGFALVARELVRLAALEQLRALPAADFEPSDLTSHVP